MWPIGEIMVDADIRSILYLPLGLLPAGFFAARILVQWFQSEKTQTSFVSPLFWRLSLIGNLLLMSHYIVQVQFPFALLQGANSVISWRNLNLLNDAKRTSTKTALYVMLGVTVGITLLFIAQSYFFIGELDWIRTPTKPWDQTRQHHALAWHIFGSVGGIIFGSRFWVQWWLAEKTQTSQLPSIFWYLSVVGSVMIAVYSFYIHDTVMVTYNLFALVPYLRNIVFMKRRNATSA